ncbi:hypothetical protein K474DRAFT_1671891 [Panus rudis PR-1116 ss-1]|nr:hypothetical protein K474DRAFT_1671891 [Panus rudis PR-1116 ss-1]
MSSTLSQLGIDAAEAVVLISDGRTNKSIALAVFSPLSLALLVYDTILVFPQEFRCVWRRKWTGVTILYVTIRYSAMLDMGLRILILFLAVAFNDAQGCKIASTTEITSEISAYIAVPVFDCLRVWAISGKNWTVATVVLVLGLLGPCLDIYSYSLPTSYALIKSDILTACIAFKTIPRFTFFGPLARGAAICSDLIVMGVTIWKTVDIVRAGHNVSVDTRYSSMLLYTGVIQFILLLALNIVNIMFDILGVTTKSSFSSEVIQINEGFMLSLQAVNLQGSSQNTSASSQSSIRFTNSIVGNLGAPIRRDNLDNILENEGSVYSDNPHQIGLSDQTEKTEIEIQPLEQLSHDSGEAGPSNYHYEDMNTGHNIIATTSIA